MSVVKNVYCNVCPFLSGEGEEDTTEPLMTLTAAGLWLGGITVLVAFLSEFLTGSIEEVGST